jgi:hypothetical protein
MAEEIADVPQQEVPQKPSLVQRLKNWDSGFSVLKNLGVVTAAVGLVGAYFQYLNSYDQSVSELAKADSATATAVFLEISNAYSEAQRLQQLLYYDFATSLAASEPGEKAMATKDAQATYPSYVKAWSTLRQTNSLFAHKVELYIDWVNDLGRPAGGLGLIPNDSMTEARLGDYDFDCSADANVPHYEEGYFRAADDGLRSCVAPGATRQVASGSRTFVCATTGDGKIDRARAPITIHWRSAKHQLVVMHYCFEVVHAKIRAARIFASGNEVSESGRDDFLNNREALRDDLDHEMTRLNAFMDLVISQLDIARAKYQPSDPVCHVPLLRELSGIFGTNCSPQFRTRPTG